MKKIIAMVLSVMLLCAAIGVTAEGADKPQFATFGDAFAAAGENPVYGGSDEYMTVIVEQDGKYIRVVTELDEKAQALDEAALESDDIDTAYAEFEAYVKTLPVSYTEEFTVQPKEQAELDGLAGKTIAELEEAGFEYTASGTGSSEDEIVFTMAGGVFAYDFVVDTDLADYEKRLESESFDDLKVKSGSFAGLSIFATELNYHADGTVEPNDEDELDAMLLELGDLIDQLDIDDGEEEEDNKDADADDGDEDESEEEFAFLTVIGGNGDYSVESEDGLSGTAVSSGHKEDNSTAVIAQTEAAKDEEGLPPYAYTGDDPIVGAIAEALASEEYAELYRTEPDSVAIPCPIIIKTEQIDEDHVKVYGNFWLMNYVLEGQTLKCISGGEAAGIIELEQEDDEWNIADMEQAGDGEDYAKDIETYANGDADLLAKYRESADMGAEATAAVRTKFIREYVEAYELDVTAYQDEGRDPVPLK